MWTSYSSAGLNKAVDSGKASAIGVSNYNAEMMRAAVSLSRHALVTNQVEYHPFLDQTAVLKEAAANASSVMAYCSMAVGRVFETQLLKDIAARRDRSVAQIVLRWLIQQPGVVALSRTEKVERIPDNLKIFDFVLTAEEMTTISGLKHSGSRIVNPPQLAPVWD
jgi:2,5-diketo-D-gluconate reductase B